MLISRHAAVHGRLFWCLALSLPGALASALAGNSGTLVILQNPTNSSPRIGSFTSVWGGGGSEQIILKSDGTVWDWGANGSGQLGDGNTILTNPLPIQVLGPGGVGYLTNVAAIQGGELHNTALMPDGTVWSWGLNAYGQLGDGSTNWGTQSNYSTTPVQVFGLTSVKSLGGRGYHTLALKTDGTIWDWGRNEFGELGIGVVFNSGIYGTNQGTNIPVQVIGLTNPASLSGGGFFSLALMSNGTVWAWGQNDAGQCGNGTNTNCVFPVQVLGLTNVTAISGGWQHSLALKSDGTVWAWGEQPNGELGDGTTINRYSPVQVVGLSNILSVRTGDGNSMALGADGTVWKWGENQYGELGNGTIDSTTVAHPTPIQVPGLSNVIFAVCRDYHNICIKRDGTVWVWGDNRYGGCGDATGNSVLSPRLMPGFATNNLIPYAESFESYASGSSIVGINSWSAATTAAAMVATTNYSLPYNGPPPIPGPQQKALQINGTVTNQFSPSYYTNLWVDMILQANPPANPPPLLSNASFALAVLTNGYLAVWNCTNPPAPGNGWTELLDAPLATNQFLRATIEANYAPDANGIFYYTVWVNGVASTNPALRYAAADSSQPWFGQLVACGDFILDDLVLETNKSFYALTASSTAYGGAIAPAGPVIVAPGSTNSFTMTPSIGYSLASVLVDSGNIGTPGAFTFTNVQADHTISANYAPVLAAGNTPEWWLYQVNPNWAVNFNAAALSLDAHGAPVWQDYIAGTDPLNPASAFALGVTLSNGGACVSLPTIATTPQYQAQRYYALQCSTNLANPASWQAISGWTNIQGLGQTLIYTNAAAASDQFFRAQVWLAP